METFCYLVTLTAELAPYLTLLKLMLMITCSSIPQSLVLHQKGSLLMGPQINMVKGSSNYERANNYPSLMGGKKVTLLAGPIFHPSTQYIDFVDFFISLDLSTIYFDHFSELPLCVVVTLSQTVVLCFLESS